MTGIAADLMAVEDRPLDLYARNDLDVSEAWYQAERSWIIKDPLSLRYCRLREPEYLVFRMLDGNHSLREIQQQMNQDFPERTTRLVDLQQLIASLNPAKLVALQRPGSGDRVARASCQAKTTKGNQAIVQCVGIAFAGIDAEPILRRVSPWTSWFFSRWCFVLCLVVCLGAGLLLLGNLDEFFSRLPAFRQFFAFQNLLVMGLILVVTKSLHELAHGLACRHFGCECHEIGFMFLVLMPAMYCDTSDSWRLPNKWQRMAIGAAGMYVEVVLAAVCTFIWWYTHPGWLHYLCLNIMFICSVSTVLFNGNPLLRFDGYYILSDWLEVPNLSQKSRMALQSQARVLFLGMDPMPARWLPQQNVGLFALYSVLAVVYRWFILIVILWFLSGIFEPYGLQVVGYFLIAVSLVALVGVPLFQLVRFFSYPGRFRQVKLPRLLVTSTVVVATALMVFLVPIPYHVVGHFVIEPANSQRVRVTLPGLLDAPLVQPGDQVEAGQVLARLRSTTEQAKLEQLRGQVAQLENEIAQLEQVANVSSFASTAIVTRETELLATRRQLTLQQERLNELELKADRAGTILPPPNVEHAVASADSRLPSWAGSPLEPRNQGAYLAADTWFCSVANGQLWEARIVVGQSDIKLVQHGQRLKLMPDEYPGHSIPGQVATVSRERISKLPRELTRVAGGRLATDSDVTSQATPLLGYYQASATVETSQLAMAAGFRGRARIHVGNHTLAWRIGRFFQTAFHF